MNSEGRLTKDEIREVVRSEGDFQARLSEDEIEEMVERLHAEQEDIFRGYLRGAINQELMRRAARGEIYWDPAVDAWQMADK